MTARTQLAITALTTSGNYAADHVLDVTAISGNTGNGNGLVDFDGVLISVFGTAAGFGATPSSIGTVTAGLYDFAQGAL